MSSFFYPVSSSAEQSPTYCGKKSLHQVLNRVQLIVEFRHDACVLRSFFHNILFKIVQVVIIL